MVQGGDKTGVGFSVVIPNGPVTISYDMFCRLLGRNYRSVLDDVSLVRFHVGEKSIEQFLFSTDQRVDPTLHYFYCSR